MTIVEQLVDKGMEKAQGVQASLNRSESDHVSFENDKLKSVKSSQGTTISVKVILEGKIGLSHTTDVSDLDGAVARALDAAAFGSSAHFTFPPPQEMPEVKTYDPNVPEIGKAEMVDLGKEMISVVKDYNPDILLSAGLRKVVSTTDFANSAGIRLSNERSQFKLGVHGQLVRGTDILWAGDSFGWRKREVDHMAVARKTVRLFQMAEETAPIRSGNLPVILAPEGMNILFLALQMGINGKNVVLGASPLAGHLGERIADECFSLRDDPLIDYGLGSGKFDGEGIPHQTTPLVVGGVLQNFLYDLDTAGRAGAQSTGNGVGCSPTNLVMDTGHTSFEEMIGNVEEGLLVYDVLGLGQGNPVSGAFSVNVNLGYKIEKGKIVGRVKDVMLAGNTYDALKDIAAIGDKAEWVGGSMIVPPVQIGNLSVVAKS